MGTIQLKNMQFYGFHGVDESEKHLGGRFEVDVEMQLSLAKACNSDELNDTVNYEKIYKTVNDCVSKDNFYLILCPKHYMGDYNEQPYSKRILLLSHLHPQINHNV